GGGDPGRAVHVHAVEPAGLAGPLRALRQRPPAARRGDELPSIIATKSHKKEAGRETQAMGPFVPLFVTFRVFCGYSIFSATGRLFAVLTYRGTDGRGKASVPDRTSHFPCLFWVALGHRKECVS